jgi:branched-chain amino acid transport system permease protein
VVKLVEDQLQVLLPKLIGTSGNFEIIVFGIVLVVVLKYAPDGLWTFVGRWLPAAPRACATGPTPPPLPARDKPQRGELLLEVQAVRKAFGGLVAVNDVSFHPRRRHRRPDRPQRRRQEHHLQPDHRRAAADQRGRCCFRGQPVGGLPRARSRRAGHVAHLPAREDDPDMTVLENVALGAPTCAAAAARCARPCCAWTAPKSALLFAEAERSSQRIGMADQMHELAGNLALGPQRLMEIARALCTDPALLLLDEPAAGLRHKEKQALAGVLRQLKAEGLSILLVEHDMDFVMGLTDRIVVMEFGTKLMEGTPAEVQASPRCARPTWARSIDMGQPLLEVTDLHAGYGRAEVLPA